MNTSDRAIFWGVSLMAVLGLLIGGQAAAASGLRLTLRDLAKIGNMIVNGGKAGDRHHHPIACERRLRLADPKHEPGHVPVRMEQRDEPYPREDNFRTSADYAAHCRAASEALKRAIGEAA